LAIPGVVITSIFDNLYLLLEIYWLSVISLSCSQMLCKTCWQTFGSFDVHFRKKLLCNKPLMLQMWQNQHWQELQPE